MAAQGAQGGDSERAMKDDGTAAGGPGGSRGLSACAQCHGIFPAARLTAAGGRPLCGDCARKFGPLTSPGAAPADPSAPAGAPQFAPSSAAHHAPATSRYGYDTRPPVSGFGGTQAGGPGGGAGPRASIRPSSWTGAQAPAAARTSQPGGSGRASQAGTPGRVSQAGGSGRASPAEDPAFPRVAGRPATPLPQWNAPAQDAAPETTAEPPRGGSSSWSGDPVRPKLAQSKYPAWDGGTVARAPAPPLAADAPAPPVVLAHAAAPELPRISNTGLGHAPSAAAASASSDLRRISHVETTGRETFADYAALRQRIDAGEDVIATRRRAAEIAARLGLHLEAVEHYRRCVELCPTDERLQRMLENVQRSVGADRGGVADRLAEPPRKVIEEARPFWEDLGSALAYPFRGAGVTVLLVGGALLGVGQLIASLNMFAAAVNVMLWGYVAAYLFDVINTTGSAKKDPPELPEATNVLESYVFPFFAYATCLVVSFVPFAAVSWLGAKGWLPGPVALVLGLVTFALGVFVFPMTLMVRAMFQSVVESATPKVVLGSIGRIFPDYVAMFIATCVLWVAFSIAYCAVFALCWAALGLPSADAVLSLDGARMVSWIFFTVVTWPLFLYTWMLQGHLLGRLYRQGIRRLAWFVAPDETTRSAKRLSAGLACGAAGSLVALCGAAYAGGKLFERWRAAPNAAALTASCPVSDGSTLTYFWENTDGMAGRTTYRFTGRPDGLLRVNASVEIAGHGVSSGDEPVGVFDPDTGVFVDAVQAWGNGVHYDGVKGEHVAFFGPRKSAIGATYVNDWSVRGSERWQNAWACWKVHDQESTRDLYFDTKTGLLVGSRFVGVGFVVTAWLTEAHNVRGVGACPPPNRNFDVEPGDDRTFDTPLLPDLSEDDR